MIIFLILGPRIVKCLLHIFMLETTIRQEAEYTLDNLPACRMAKTVRQTI